MSEILSEKGHADCDSSRPDALNNLERENLSFVKSLEESELLFRPSELIEIEAPNVSWAEIVRELKDLNVGAKFDDCDHYTLTMRSKVRVHGELLVGPMWFDATAVVVASLLKLMRVKCATTLNCAPSPVVWFEGRLLVSPFSMEETWVLSKNPRRYRTLKDTSPSVVQEEELAKLAAVVAQAEEADRCDMANYRRVTIISGKWFCVAAAQQWLSRLLNGRISCEAILKEASRNYILSSENFTAIKVSTENRLSSAVQSRAIVVDRAEFGEFSDAYTDVHSVTVMTPSAPIMIARTALSDFGSFMKSLTKFKAPELKTETDEFVMYDEFEYDSFVPATKEGDRDYRSHTLLSCTRCMFMATHRGGVLRLDMTKSRIRFSLDLLDTMLATMPVCQDPAQMRQCVDAAAQVHIRKFAAASTDMHFSGTVMSATTDVCRTFMMHSGLMQHPKDFCLGPAYI